MTLRPYEDIKRLVWQITKMAKQLKTENNNIAIWQIAKDTILADSSG